MQELHDLFQQARAEKIGIRMSDSPEPHLLHRKLLYIKKKLQISDIHVVYRGGTVALIKAEYLK